MVEAFALGVWGMESESTWGNSRVEGDAMQGEGGQKRDRVGLFTV